MGEVLSCHGCYDYLSICAIFELASALKRHDFVFEVRRNCGHWDSSVSAMPPLNPAEVAKPNPLTDFVQHLG
jgi:hypothetical protein